MERKVGEIFEYNGEWNQCMEGIGCFRSAYYDKNICIADNPQCTRTRNLKRSETLMLRMD